MDLQIQCNPYQISAECFCVFVVFFFSETDKVILKFIGKFKRPRMVKAILKKTKLGPHISQFQNLLEVWSNKDNMLLA